MGTPLKRIFCVCCKIITSVSVHPTGDEFSFGIFLVRSLFSIVFLHFFQHVLCFSSAKDKTRAEKKRVFANVVLLHADVYLHMKVRDGNRLPILAEPLIHYLEDLLEDNPRSNILFILAQV